MLVFFIHYANVMGHIVYAKTVKKSPKLASERIVITSIPVQVYWFGNVKHVQQCSAVIRIPLNSLHHSFIFSNIIVVLVNFVIGILKTNF